jgi:hypothetical protein
MNVEMKWINVQASSFMEPFLKKEVSKLERQFPHMKHLDVRVRKDAGVYQARVGVQALGRDWWVSGAGESVQQGIAQAFLNLKRKIGEFKRFSRDKINKRFKRPAALREPEN